MARSKKREKFSKFVGKSKTDFEIYQSGALVGSLLGGVVGLLMGKRIVLCIVGGALVGGYLNYQIHEDDSNTLNIHKFSKQQTDKNDIPDGNDD